MIECELTEEQISQETIFEGKIIRVYKDSVRLPNGKSSVREIVRHPGAVAIVPQLDDKILMVKQYRYALAKETLEIPAGKIDPGETPETCALRELREETGYIGDITYIGGFHTSPGFTDEIIHIYQAVNLVWSPLEADEDEFLNVVPVLVQEAMDLVIHNGLHDAKTALGILLTCGGNK
ncbi:NUDIX hydrolase [Dehalobacter sp. DCM]|uniref:NUDIX domain-containing protein n=1 Tax=Dehalobacter sp. DCM TaxID=2907827 RepID=UPI003081403F|nr:NUDIX hydrolase [Dehalobacter sp. DCM]